MLVRGRHVDAIRAAPDDGAQCFAGRILGHADGAAIFDTHAEPATERVAFRSGGDFEFVGVLGQDGSGFRMLELADVCQPALRRRVPGAVERKDVRLKVVKDVKFSDLLQHVVGAAADQQRPLAVLRVDAGFDIVRPDR